MSACDDKRLLLNALVDGELDAANTVEIEQHLRTCPGCAAAFAELQAVREVLGAAGVRYEAPEPFRRRLLIALNHEARTGAKSRPRRLAGPRWWSWAPWVWAPSGGLAAAGVAAMLFAGVQVAQAPLSDELVSDHVRSLLASHLMDVPTSDRHVVKPWFDGKVAFAPTVIDFKDRGFPLVGGRLDLVRGQRAAALVYRRRLHVINVFVWPEAPADRLALDRTRDGYHLVHWRNGGLNYWAVSDLDPTELQQFRDLYVAALGR
jgi:anti-sigma factor RsiW